MAYTRRRSASSARRRNVSRARPGARRGTSVRRNSRGGSARRVSRSPQTVKIVIEHAGPSAGNMMPELGQTQRDTKKAKF